MTTKPQVHMVILSWQPTRCCAHFVGHGEVQDKRDCVSKNSEGQNVLILLVRYYDIAVIHCMLYGVLYIVVL